jgi:hypothetical protein
MYLKYKQSVFCRSNKKKTTVEKCKKIYISAIFEGVIHDQEDQKAFARSRNIAPINSPLSMAFNHLSIINVNAVWQE